MKYLVFAYDSSYPSGASSELKDAFSTLEEAKEFATGFLNTYDQVEIFDMNRLISIEYGSYNKKWNEYALNISTKLEKALK